jgi:hypothetical protein
MNDEAPPLGLGDPAIFDRRPEARKAIVSTPEAIAARSQKAATLQAQLIPVKRHFQRLTVAQRRAFFVKLRHKGPISLVGTGLKLISPVSDTVTLATPESALDKLDTKISAYGAKPIKNGVIPEQALIGRLEDISIGSPLDRLSEEIHASFNEYVTKAWIVVELELTSIHRGKNQRRADIAEKLLHINRFLGPGMRGSMYEHEEDNGSCRAIIGCTGEALRTLVLDDEWQTVINWFELPPQFETFHQTLQNFSVNNIEPIAAPAGNNVVCVVDSGVLAGNPFLRPITRADLQKSFLKNRAADIHDQHGHGSGVASLASYYALNIANGASNQGRFWIASARILDENNELKDRLLSAVLEEVVAAFQPIGIKIFNLSVNVVNRPWNASTRRLHPKRSWVARTIDRLVRKYDVVFVVSSGNLAIDTVKSLHAGKPYPSYFSHDTCSILDPAQAALAITVGSLAATTQLVGPVGQMTAIAEKDQPSPFTRIGPGIRREFKPEVVEYGGNLAFDHSLSIVRQNPGCNIVVASGTLSPSITTSFGSSFSTPKVTWQLARLLEDLQSLHIEPHSVLLRALIVSSAQYPQSHACREVIEALPENVDFRNILGYGVPDAYRGTFCDDYTVTMFYQGTLASNKVALFDIPVPEILVSAGRAPKSISITLAFDPEVHNRGFGDYFGSTMQWRLFRGDVDKAMVVNQMSRPDDDANEELDDDDKAEISVKGQRRERLDLSNSANGITARSRGSVQHDYFRWDDHREEYSQNHYTLAITSFEKWQRRQPGPVRYAVVVRIEEHSRQVPIYDAIALVLEPAVEVSL